MDTFRRQQGGTAGNQAYTLGLLQIKPWLAVTVGSDFGQYRNHLLKAGVNLKAMKKVKDKTATGFAMADRDNNQVWGFYSGAMKAAKGLSLKPWLKTGDWVIISPNDPKAMENYIDECVGKGVNFLFDPAFRLKLTKSQILKSGVILITTYGAKGSLIEKGFEAIKVPSAKPLNNSDPTGAGDAYRAGFLAGYLKKLPLAVCGRMGALTAVYTVEKFGTQTHKFSLTEFKKRYKTNFGYELRY